MPKDCYVTVPYSEVKPVTFQSMAYYSANSHQIHQIEINYSATKAMQNAVFLGSKIPKYTTINVKLGTVQGRSPMPCQI